MKKQCTGGFAPTQKLLGSVSIRLDTLEIQDVGLGPIEEDARPALTIGTEPQKLISLPNDVEPYVGGFLRGLAIACFYLLIGQAHPRFPTTSRSAPSKKVYVFPSRLPLLRPGDAALFPLVVDWRRWHFAVVPVLQDERWASSLPLNQKRLLDSRYSEYIEYLERALILSFKEAGYIPASL